MDDDDCLVDVGCLPGKTATVSLITVPEPIVAWRREQIPMQTAEVNSPLQTTDTPPIHQVDLDEDGEVTPILADENKNRNEIDRMWNDIFHEIYQDETGSSTGSVQTQNVHNGGNIPLEQTK